MLMSKLSKRVLKAAILFVFGILLLFLIFRNPLLHYVIGKVGDKRKFEKGLTLKIGSSSFSGFSTVALGKVSLIPQSGYTLLIGDTLRIRPSIWTLFTGTLRIKQVEASGIQLRLVNKKAGSNYKFVSEEKKKEKVEKSMANGYSYFIARLLDIAFNFAPQKAEISNASLLFVNDTLEREVRLNKFHSDVNSVKGEF